jgi:4-diphosphocytidyl-2C-methyl-D-erythritol kinase
MSKVNDGLFNRLQEPALELEPALGLLFEALRKAGAKKPLLCGSGSAIFALFEHDDRALEVAKSLIHGPARNLIQHTFITRQAIKSCDN